jgi:hypothetical protein
LDLTRLNDDELEKAAGEPEDGATPLFIIERVFVDAAEPTFDETLAK